MNKYLSQVALEIDGSWRVAADHELDLKIETLDDGWTWIRAEFVNRSSATVKLGAIRFEINGLQAVDLSALRVYREGWTMASACGSVRYGECDFEIDPSYQRFAVTRPDLYSSSEPNRFSAEHVAMINDPLEDNTLLAGFISSADQLTRFSVRLENPLEFHACSMTDGIEIAPGERIASEELVVKESSDAYGLLEEFADLWGRRMKARSWDHVPTGWCSWYYYFSDVTGKDMYENIDFLAEHKHEFKIELIQLDDGYQAALGDWLSCNSKFPGGLQALASKIRNAGFKPGLWLAPFMVEEGSELFKNHPEWMVYDEKDSVIWASEWRGARVAVLDGTHPGAQAYLKEVFSQLVAWGFEYVKLDFLVWACIGQGGCYHDPKATRAQALRRGMEAIRESMKDHFILGCTAPLGQVVGIVNGERIATDITPRWRPAPPRKIYKEAPTVPNVCRNVINRSYMNGRLWISDPDTHIARNDNSELSENEVLLWTYALYMSGGMMLLSDRFGTLSPDRAKLSKLLLESAAGIFRTRPLDFLEREYPSVWMRENDGEILLAFFNFEDHAREISADLSRIEKDKSFRIVNFHTGDLIAEGVAFFSAEVSAHSCLIMSLS